MTSLRELSRPLAIGVVMLALLAAPPAIAGQPPPSTSAAQEGFVPVEKLPQQEGMPAVPLVATAYAFAWVMLFGYLWSIRRRLSAVEREIETVSRRVGGGRPS